jgi:hypothetical protein
MLHLQVNQYAYETPPSYTLTVITLSCKNEKEQQLKRDIVGEWEFVKYDFSSGKRIVICGYPDCLQYLQTGLLFSKTALS